MNRTLWLFIGIWLAGFAGAAITAGAPAAVVVGTFGFLATVATVAVRVERGMPPAHRYRSR